MEDLKKLWLKIDGSLPKHETAWLILTLTPLGINAEGKPGTVSNKWKLIRWMQNAFEDTMEDVDKEPEERKTTLQDLLFFVEKFDGNKW